MDDTDMVDTAELLENDEEDDMEDDDYSYGTLVIH